jgi:hypothetical protein
MALPARARRAAPIGGQGHKLHHSLGVSGKDPGPAARAAEVNAGPVPFLPSLAEPQAMGRELNQTHTP